MKKFIKQLLYFLIPIVVFAVGTDVFLSYHIKKSPSFAHGEYPVWNDIYSGSIKADIAVYGSSRAWVHIDPQIIEEQLDKSAYNFGIDGHGFWLQYLRHLKLLEHNPKPETIIVSVDAFTFRRGPTLYNKEQFLPHIFDLDVYKFTSTYEGYSASDYILPLARYVGNKNAITTAFDQFRGKKDDQPGRVKGYRGSDKVWNKDLENARKGSSGYTVEIGKESLDLFDRFLQECREQNIKVILVYTPEYIEGQQFIKNRKELIETYQGFAKKFELDFLDYSSDEMCLDKKYFYNATHLNRTGSQLLTRKLANDLQL